MNELVKLTTQDVGKGIIRANSLEVAEHFKKSHKNVLQNIRNLTAENPALKKMFLEDTFITERGKEVTMYYMNRDGFSLLCMGFTGSKALEWKIKYIEAFNFMEREHKARLQTRHIGIMARKVLTETIKKCVTDEGNFKKFAYGTYTKLVYKKIIGKDVKKIKEERKVKENENVRDYFTIEELDKIQDLESKIATFIEFTDTNGKTDKEIYAMVKEHLEK